MSFKGKNALVTGSSRGIGRGIALKLAKEGARVAVNYYHNQEAALATLVKIREIGSNGFLVQADVCRPEEVTPEKLAFGRNAVSKFAFERLSAGDTLVVSKLDRLARSLKKLIATAEELERGKIASSLRRDPNPPEITTSNLCHGS